MAQDSVFSGFKEEVSRGCDVSDDVTRDARFDQLGDIDFWSESRRVRAIWLRLLFVRVHNGVRTKGAVASTLPIIIGQFVDDRFSSLSPRPKEVSCRLLSANQNGRRDHLFHFFDL